MYKSKVSISKRTTSENKKIVKNYLKKHKTFKCGVLRRKIFLEKFYKVNEKRKSASIRFQSFFAGLDILRKARKYTKKIIDGYTCFEIIGYAKNEEIVSIHLREETYQKDKKLFLLSTFYSWKQKQASPP